MSLSVGIVGLPNVGKSTLFNALLKRQQALAANYPFATIEPNVGIVAVPDDRLGKLAEVVANESRDPSTSLGMTKLPPLVPATVEFVDIAGIVAGAHKGEGLGNQFLSHIREVDLIAHVVREFDDADVINTGKGLKDDFETIVNELVFKDLDSVEKQGLKLKKDRSKEGEAKKVILEKLTVGFNEGKRASQILTAEELVEIKDWFLLTAKPFILVLNVSEADLTAAESKKVSVGQALGIKADDVVVVSAKIESELAMLAVEDAELFMADLGISESGLERLAKVAYERLGLMSFLTAGEKEVRAWTIVRGDTAPKAAGVIHTDFEKKFIKAEVVSFDDFIACNGWKGARESGKLRLEGRDYVMQDGNVVDFKIGS